MNELLEKRYDNLLFTGETDCPLALSICKNEREVVEKSLMRLRKLFFLFPLHQRKLSQEYRFDISHSSYMHTKTVRKEKISNQRNRQTFISITEMMTIDDGTEKICGLSQHSAIVRTFHELKNSL